MALKWLNVKWHAKILRVQNILIGEENKNEKWITRDARVIAAAAAYGKNGDDENKRKC